MGTCAGKPASPAHFNAPPLSYQQSHGYTQPFPVQTPRPPPTPAPSISDVLWKERPSQRGNNPGAFWSDDEDEVNPDDVVVPIAAERRRRKGVSGGPLLDRKYDSRHSSSAADLPGKRMRLGLCGIRNYSTYCFINSVVQCLSHTVPLTEFLLSPDWAENVQLDNKLGHGGQLAGAYVDLLTNLWIGNRPVARPNKFLRELFSCSGAELFDDGEQHDAQEFLAYILDGLHEEFNTASQRSSGSLESGVDEDPSGIAHSKQSLPTSSNAYLESVKAAMSWNNHQMKNKSVIGQLRLELRCTDCGTCSVSFDPFMYLHLPVERKRPDRSVYTVDSLQEALETFTGEEILSAKNRWLCPRCETHVKAVKRVTIWKLPPLLIVHFKRFSYSKSGRRKKLGHMVEFPMDGLDLKPFLDVKAVKSEPESTYSCYAALHHIGGSTDEGHYTATAFHSVSSLWYEFNDSLVTRVEKADVVSPTAYVLMYCQVSMPQAAPNLSRFGSESTSATPPPMNEREAKARRRQKELEDTNPVVVVQWKADGNPSNNTRTSSANFAASTPTRTAAGLIASSHAPLIISTPVKGTPVNPHAIPSPFDTVASKKRSGRPVSAGRRRTHSGDRL